MNPGKKHVITTAVEHSANINYGEYLQKRGCDVTCPVESDGLLDIHLLEKSIRPDTALVSVMMANNETGVLLPIAAVAAICRSRGVLFHTDAVQVPGKLKIDVKELGVDFLSLSAHKLHAPKGIGMLYVKRRTRFQPYIIGGHQERRSGTENVANIVAFGRAAELAVASLTTEYPGARIAGSAGEFHSGQDFQHRAERPSRPTPAQHGQYCLRFRRAVLLLLDQLGICASSGSACTTESLDPSHVLTAMGLPAMRARGSVRFSLGIYNTDADVDYVCRHLPSIIQRLRIFRR